MKRVLARVGVALAVALLAVLVYGVAIEPRLILDERRYESPIPELGPQWEGAEVALFADLQLGMWWDNSSMVERVVDRIVQERPAAALVAGDFLYSSSPDVPEQISTVLRLLEPLVDAGIPTYAVLGNHDYAVGAADELTTALEAVGIPVLENEAVALPPPAGDDGGEPLYLVGLAATRPGLTDVSEALSGLPEDAPRVVMMHNPSAFPRLPAGTAPLAVAGHTHCGQIAVPGAPRWSYLALLQEDHVVADGFAAPGYGAEGNRLFVTCGIGFSVVPMRVNAPPQLVFFELTAG